MSFYLWAMRSASVILFVVAILVIISVALAQASILINIDHASYGPGQDSSLIQFALTLTGALQSAVLPLFGSAILWRADRWMAGNGAAK